MNFTIRDDGTMKTLEEINANRSSEVLEAFWEVLAYEYRDKTFLLLIVFCIIWQQGRKKNLLIEMVGDVPISNSMLSLRVFIASTTSISCVKFFQIDIQQNVYSYQTNALVATILIIGLTVYMYTICQDYIKDLIDEELNDKSSYAAAASKKSTQEIVKKIKHNQKEMIEIKRK